MCKHCLQVLVCVFVWLKRHILCGWKLWANAMEVWCNYGSRHDSVRSCTVTHAGRDKPQSAHSSSCVHAHSGGTGNRYSLYPRTYCSTVALVGSASWGKVFFSGLWKLAQTTGLLKSFKICYGTRFILIFWLRYGHFRYHQFNSKNSLEKRPRNG